MNKMWFLLLKWAFIDAESGDGVTIVVCIPFNI